VGNLCKWIHTGKDKSEFDLYLEMGRKFFSIQKLKSGSRAFKEEVNYFFNS